MKNEKNINDMVTDLENERKPLLAQALGEQVINLLIETGIANLRVEESGQVSGQTRKLQIYPRTSYLGNIHLVIEDGKIVIKAEVTGSSENIGSVI